MIWIVATIAWGFLASLIGALVAVALNRWFASWSVTKRVFVAALASVAPSCVIVGILAARYDRLSVVFTYDEFLIKFPLHFLVILAISTPIAWRVSRRPPRKPVPTDAFD